MNLVGYSDSEGSDAEAPSASKTAARPNTKPAPKLVDPTTNKVKVNLSSLTSGASTDKDSEKDARPAKRQRTGGGLNINAFLPAPKQPAKSLNNDGISAGKRTPGKGLGKGVNLKTGAEPAFTRAEASSSLDLDGEPKDIKEVIAELRRGRPSANSNAGNGTSITQEASDTGSKEVKLVGNPIRFKPKSIARNAPKKKKAMVEPSATLAAPSARPHASTTTTDISSAPPLTTAIATPVARTKPSLFSLNHEDTSQPIQPAEANDDSALQDDADMEEVPDEAFETEQQAQSKLTDDPRMAQPSNVVHDLQLSANDMRQLFGRKAGKRGNMPDLESIKMVNFNADAEYAANEELRAKGETVQHNPVRAIAPGKHSLKQLVNAAATQKDALEEHFAQGKRSQREAGSRYGW